MRLNQLFSEASQADMSDAMRWISLLKPYFVKAFKEQSKRKYLEVLSKIRRYRRLPDPQPIAPKFVDEWVNRLVFNVEVPQEIINILIPRDLHFHVDDEFNDPYSIYRQHIFIVDGNELRSNTINIPKVVSNYFIKLAKDYLSALRDNIEMAAR